MSNNRTQNTTDSPEDNEGPRQVLLWIVSFMSVTACVSNLLVITTILGTKTLRTISSVFLLNLAFCDFIIGIVMMPIMVNNVRNDGCSLSQESCVGIGLLNYLLQCASIYTVTAISLDRYITIIHCLKYSSWSQLKYISFMLVMIWILSISISFPTLSRNFGSIDYDTSRYICLPNWQGNDNGITITLICLYLVPIVIMSFCYLKIIGVARAHARKISDVTKQINKNITERNRTGLFGQEMLGPVHRISMISFPAAKAARPMDNGFVQMPHRISERSLSRFEREARAAIRLVGLVISFIVCWTPHITVSLALGYGKMKAFLPEWSLPVSACLVYFHSTFNPFLYAIISKRFRFALKRMFSKWFHSVIGANQVVNVSEIRSKCFETEHGLRTVSMFPVRRIATLDRISEHQIAPQFKQNVIPRSRLSLSSEAEGIKLPGMAVGMTKGQGADSRNIRKAKEKPDIYLSIPRKTFTHGNGSLRIETVKSNDSISTKIIRVQEYKNSQSENTGKSHSNTKIRICVDLTS